VTEINGTLWLRLITLHKAVTMKGGENFKHEANGSVKVEGEGHRIKNKIEKCVWRIHTSHTLT